MQKTRNYQDQILEEAIQKKSQLTFFMQKGMRFTGYVQSFDTFTVFIHNQKSQLLLFKHAVTSIVPARQKKDRKHPSTLAKKSKKVSSKTDG